LHCTCEFCTRTRLPSPLAATDETQKKHGQEFPHSPFSVFDPCFVRGLELLLCFSVFGLCFIRGLELFSLQ